MIVTVTADDLSNVVGHGSVVEVTGTNEDGQIVIFAGAALEMTTLLDVVYELGEADAEVEAWQIRKTYAIRGIV
jgi:hypothetical protein